MIEQFAETLARCPTMSDVQRSYGAAIAREGFSTFAGHRFDPRARERTQTFFLNWPEGWKQLSKERKFAAKSPLFDEARRRHSPFTWGQMRAGRTADPAEGELWTAVSEWGWTDGFVVPIHGPGGYLATMGMASREKGLDLGHAARTRLFMMAVVTHERCLALGEPDRARDLREVLTTRELECLKWVAEGRTDEKIGAILGISPDTVRFHVDNVRGKLGVRSRAQAVARLCLAGLL